MKFLVYCAGILVVSVNSASSAEDTGVPLESAIATVNAEVATSGLAIIPLTEQCVQESYRSRREFEFTKSERSAWDQGLVQGRLQPGQAFSIINFQGITPRIDLYPIAVVRGLHCDTWETQFLPELADARPAMDENQFSGTPLPETATALFPKSVPIQIRELLLSARSGNQEAHLPALDIRFQITSKNIEDLSAYFGTGYSASETQRRLVRLLGVDAQKWISIRQIFTGWPSKWMNRFPQEKSEEEGSRANDVCFGVSRQFFRDKLANGALDRSTEATEWMLKENYRLLPDSAEPTFGDYLYLPGAHGIRFILKDPDSGRWIGFTAWSDHLTPYRLWWIDRDYANPLNGDIVARPGFPRTMDLWRRIGGAHESDT